MTNWRRALARSFGWLATAPLSPATAAAVPAQEGTSGKGSNVDDTLTRGRRGDDSMYVWWLLVGAGFAAGIAAASLIRNSSR